MSPVTVIYALSDSVGETAEMIARAMASQFEEGTFEIMRVPNIKTVQQLERTMREAASQRSLICHTLVNPELRAALKDQAIAIGVPTVDIMGPMLEAGQKMSGMSPKLRPGLIHRLDDDYFKRVEAIEFAVKYDDGKNPMGLKKAEIVLVGVSRTSKTPLSMFLAHKMIKVANVPLVPEVEPPEQLFEIPTCRIVGLIIDPKKLNNIRMERLRSMGLDAQSAYADDLRIEAELAYAKKIMERLQCPVLDVSNKAIEETAGKILQLVRENGCAIRSVEA
ncbi:pyruvate, water dikinase regulatory protein [Azotosporobacter soli]|uniref:pyruvate, water dikinase regulatory protein n=1 Tax=Azotosporobacter soli TaxID=3055040 RepID=UPI0031FEF002